MEDVKIEYNMAIELLIALEKYASHISRITDLRKDEAEALNKLENEAYIEFTPNNDIRKWYEHIDSDISPFLKNDISHLLGMRASFMSSINDIVLMNNLMSPAELVRYLQKMDS